MARGLDELSGWEISVGQRIEVAHDKAGYKISMHAWVVMKHQWGWESKWMKMRIFQT